MSGCFSGCRTQDGTNSWTRERRVRVKISQLQSSLDSLLQRLGIGDNLRPVLFGAGLLMMIQAASAALNYVSQVLLARWMGPSEFGVYVFAWSWAHPISVAAAIGLSAAAIRFVPQYFEKDDWGKLHGLIRRSTTLVLVVGVLHQAGQLSADDLDDLFVAIGRRGLRS